MPRHRFFKAVSLFIFATLVISVLLTGVSISQAQPPTSPGTATDKDDSDQLPIYINITGYVQTITPTSLTINNLVILIPAGMTLPANIAVGKVASLHGNLRNDDKITLITIVFGYHLPTSTPVASPTPAATGAASAATTTRPTLEATAEGTVPPTLPAAADCNKPRQSLGVMISAAYRVSYNEVIRLHCRGYTFGVIARGEVLVFAAKDVGKHLTIDTILILRLKGDDWSTIIIILGVQPDSTLVILILNGGHATVLFNCGSGITRKHAAICIGISFGRGNGGGGKGGEHGEDDDD